MKELNEFIESRRVTKGPFASPVGSGNNGMFMIWFSGREWCVVISNGMGWDHVSVSHPKITPSWDVMCYFKDLFFSENETVLQFHPAKEDYINNHAHCLHLWRPQDEEIPKPPKLFVGIDLGKAPQVSQA